MNRSYRITYRHPRTGVAGVSFLVSEIELAVEKAQLESQGYVVTNVFRPIGASPELHLADQYGSASQ
jgi:hypothetical protein